MRTCIFLPVGLVLFFLIQTPCFAEYYRYTDEYGIAHYTDNLGEVPVDLRKKVKKFTIPEDHLTEEQKKALAEERKAIREAKMRRFGYKKGGDEEGKSAAEIAENAKKKKSGEQNQLPPPGGQSDNKQPEAKPEAKQPKTPGAAGAAGRELADLQNEKHDIDLLKKKLEEAEAKLKVQRSKAKTRDEFIAYSMAVNDFNKQVRSFEAKRSAYEERAKAVNSAMGLP